MKDRFEQEKMEERISGINSNKRWVGCKNREKKEARKMRWLNRENLKIYSLSQVNKNQGQLLGFQLEWCYEV